MPMIRDEWINRPTHLMRLSLEEYIAQKENKSSPAPPMLNNVLAATGGRTKHTSGQMNGLEKKYAAHLDIRKVCGEIADWKFEPLKLKLAPATFYNPDFGLLMPDGKVELHETKGSHWEDDARVKIKVAAEMFTWFRFRAAQWDKNSKDWKFEEFR